MTRTEQMRLACQRFHAAHPEVWELFVKFSRQKIREGFEHYGAKAVMERVRWETEAARPGGGEYRINNNHCRFYAERFNKIWREGFFRSRRGPASTEADAGLPPPSPLWGKTGGGREGQGLVE